MDVHFLLFQEGEGLVRKMSELKGRLGLMASKLVVEKQCAPAILEPETVYRDDYEERAYKKPTSAGTEDGWDVAPDHSADDEMIQLSEDEDGADPDQASVEASSGDELDGDGSMDEDDE
jgi:hypothetical protein